MSTAPLEVTGLPRLDTGFAIARLGGSGNVFLAVADAFLGEVEEIHAALQRAAMPTQPDDPVATCHELASSFGMIGALRGERLARDTEQRLRAGVDFDAVTAGLLRAELKAVAAQLTQHVKAARAEAG